ncbi:MAG: peptide deformylase [Alphaproteobacteria bacterium]|jgi:peptide deformylase|nr:peptide deformylase [Alphaproteobacteria bacterium]
MALLPIITAPDPRLKLVASRVDAVDDGVRRLMDDMLETMYEAPGVGLAAPQVGVSKRVIVADVARSGEAPQPMLMANPEIIEASQERVVFEEGCLSLPEHFADVKRHERIRIRYLDRENEIREQDVEGFLATCVQHEIDHLDGVLFVDHISGLKRGMIMRKLTKLKKQDVKADA